ncbi:MAG: hypothetical protein KGI72_04965 [Patescibacteria group bacterium]|nr:RAD52 family DNA repair protein [Patescibacteria group bacterium]MDE2015844.1 hypothetical protein [Patescibacteria group bacterium]
MTEDHGKKLMVGKSVFTTEQILRTLQRTPPHHVYQRPAKGGGTWQYVTGVYIKKCLNYTFGWMWSSTVLDIREKHGQVCATIRLTIHKPDGSELLHKDDIGKKDIIMRKGTTEPLDYGNDEKAAVTDGLKRCAAQFGFASDIYGKNEFKEISVEELTESKEIPKDEHDNDPATSAQIQTMKSLKIPIPPNLVQSRAKELIAAHLEGGKK